MKSIKGHRRTAQNMLRVSLKSGERILYFVADAVGFVVAEVRMKLVPEIRKIRYGITCLYNAGRERIKIRLNRSFSSESLKTRNKAVSEPKISVRLPMSRKPLEKKYTYEWAVFRLQELDEIGVSDPVSYFNNEMADWWLAPGGMMEQEADFAGIARAIEERWHH